jgi:hypothetical protein
MHTSSGQATRWTYAGLFLTSLATLMHEILLTRIFSVTMWYHFAFVAVSLAMFGMTVGALIVFLRPGWFPADGLKTRLASVMAAYPLLLLFTFLIQLSVPFIVHPSVVGVFSIAFVYAVVAVPFVTSGIVFCLALTRFPSKVSQLYGADLIGAALGCLVLVVLLPWTDGPTAMIVVAAVGAAAAVVFAYDTPSRMLRRSSAALLVLLSLAAAGHTVLVWRNFPVLRILWAKGAFEPRPLYERWNSYSRVRVIGDPAAVTTPFARSISPAYPKDMPVHELRLDIDVAASTFMLKYNGDPAPMDFLKHDVVNIGHHLKPDGDSLVIGTGGARDVVSALVFGARSVTGVEINKQIVNIVNGPFGDYSGHLDRNPRVRFVNDEARSYLARTPNRFDFIQISLIDTWAATAAGAFVLSENSLYTVEGWQVFLRRLNDAGLLSVCRWYSASEPAEVYRLVSLATAALQAAGATNPRDHLLLIRARPVDDIAVATLLVSRTPLTEAAIDRLEGVARDQQFEVMLSPRTSADPVLTRLLSPSERPALLASYPLNLAAPTDDSPFFFQMLRLRNFFRADLVGSGKLASNLEAVLVLGTLLLTVIVLSVLCIFVPLALASDRSVLHRSGSLLAFFTSIGLGFMLIETSQMQRLIVALGHPTYGLTVVLFTLLLAGGVGSQITSGIASDRLSQAGAWRLLVLVALLVAIGLVTPSITARIEGQANVVRIAVAIALLAPLGIAMGMAFPIGMRLAAGREPRLTPWLWGANGAASVSAAVLSVAVALATSISTAYWMGVVCYAFAWIAFMRARTVHA